MAITEEKIVVETFECDEVIHEPVEVAEEAKKLIEEMGLEGQKSFLRKDEKTGLVVPRLPYKVLSAEQLFIVTHLCPTVVNAEDYAASPFPLRILEVIGNCKKFNFFQTVEIHDVESSTVKDPFVIGVTYPVDNSWNKTRYLIARWGNVLEDWSTLLIRACKTHRESLIKQAEEAKVNIVKDLAALPLLTDSQLAKISGINYYSQTR